MEESPSIFLLVFLQLSTIEKQGTRSRAKHEYVLPTRIPLIRLNRGAGLFLQSNNKVFRISTEQRVGKKSELVEVQIKE